VDEIGLKGDVQGGEASIEAIMLPHSSSRTTERKVLRSGVFYQIILPLKKKKSIREVTKRDSPPAISPEVLILIRLGTKV
jgi:hypothetical protein